MLGNVWEWCADPAEGFGAPDRYSAEAVVDPVAPDPERPYRVFRGGSWNVRARDARAACRLALRRGDAGYALGFRVARGRAPRSSEPAERGPRSGRAEPRAGQG